MYINEDGTIELDVTHFSVYCVMGGVSVPEAGVFDLTNIANYPNPFVSGTGTDFMFYYQAPSYDTLSTKVTIKIYTVSGRLIKRIETDSGGNIIKADYGSNQVHWNGLDEDGRALANGVYHYVLRVEDAGIVLEKFGKFVVVE